MISIINVPESDLEYLPDIFLTKLMQNPVELGGPAGVVIQIYESLFNHKAKYNCGRRASKEQWGFGLIGEKLPTVCLFENTPDNPVNLQELFKGKKGVLFSVVGAFTPGCTQSHIPEYLDHFDKFKDEGYDLICCVSVNDPFVMSAWGQQVKADGKIRMLADPMAEFTKAMKMDLDCKKLLGNTRSKRYCLVIEDGTIKSIMTEPNHTGLACLLCIKNFSKGKSVYPENLPNR